VEADKQLLTQVSPSSDTRNIWMLDTTAPTKLKRSVREAWTLAEQAFFTNKCAAMTSAAVGRVAEARSQRRPALVGFLRGQTGQRGGLSATGSRPIR